MYNFKLENFSNSSSSVSKIISQFKLVVTWNQDFDDISHYNYSLIILFSQKFNLKKFVDFWFQLAPALMAVGLEWNQKFKNSWFHFGSIGSILVPLVPLWNSIYKNSTVDVISGGDLCFEIIWQTLNYPIYIIRAEGIACRHWVIGQWLFLADSA